MSYKTYITEAFVCGARASNTSDRSYLLFTRDAGMLYASAKSVREERSKHRYALQEFSHVRVTLVSGKAGWRVTGAESLGNAYALQRTREARALVRNIVRVLRRLMHGEVPHEHVFDEVVSVLMRTHAEHESAFEEVLTIRILHALGYIAPTPELRAICDHTDIDSLIGELEPSTAHFRRKTIEHALRESHL